MYLKKLYRQSKLWFMVAVLFAVGQLFINYKSGVEASPFYHYSMFSGNYQFLPFYEATEVTVNGERLQSKDFTPNGWDNIVIPITQYRHQQIWNSNMYHQTIQRFLGVKDSSLYMNHLSQTEFDAWYKQRIIRLMKIQDAKADVQYRIVLYKQQNDSLLP